MGSYNLNKLLKIITNCQKNPEFVSEHVLFNMNFDLEIMEDWNIPAPPEH